MKKLAIVASLVAVFGSVGMAQAANTGTITFNGELTDTTCDVKVDGVDTDATVILPTVSVKQLEAVTNTAGDTGFVMSLDCSTTSLTTASAFFQAGATVDTNTGRLKNTNTGGAGNVTLQLLDGSKTGTAAVIKAGSQEQVTGSTRTTLVDISGGTANLPYTVRYYAEGKTTPGLVVSQVVYSMNYQ